MNSFEDYHDYMQSDSSLFCDTFKIVEVCLKTYDLDPTHLYSAPGLVWIAALKKTTIT